MGEAERRCGAKAAAQWGLVTREQALAAGLSRNAIDSRVKSGSWSAVHRGVFQLLPPEDEWLAQVMAATLAVDGAACGACAAALWRMDAFDRPRPIQVVTSLDRRNLAGSVQVRRVNWLTPRLLTVRERVRVLNPVHTLLHLGDFAPRDEVEAALDFCLRRNVVTLSGLTDLCEEVPPRGSTGPSVLRELLALRLPLRTHTDSLLETRLLQRLRDFGFPSPALQYPIRDGRHIAARADLAFPKHRVLIEAVGKHAHASELRQLTRDCRRANAIALLRRWTVLSFTWEQVMFRPEEVRSAVARALGFGEQLDFPLPSWRTGSAGYSPR